MIPTLVAAGIEWVIVPNNHISRACQDYPYSPSGDNNNPYVQVVRRHPESCAGALQTLLEHQCS